MILLSPHQPLPHRPCWSGAGRGGIRHGERGYQTWALRLGLSLSSLAEGNASSWLEAPLVPWRPRPSAVVIAVPSLSPTFVQQVMMSAYEYRTSRIRRGPTVPYSYWGYWCVLLVRLLILVPVRVLVTLGKSATYQKHPISTTPGLACLGHAT